MNKHLALVMVLATLPAWAQPVLDIQLGDGDFAGYFERISDGVALGVAPTGKKCLQIGGAVSSLALKGVPLKPLEKYKLTIRAAVAGKDTVESNDRLLEFALRASGRGFPGYQLTFLDQEGQETGFRLYGSHLVGHSGVILSGQVNDYVHVFYAPPKADRMRLDLSPRQNKLLIERIKLEVETDEGTVNCNPDFRYGEFSPSGWKPDVEGRLYRRPDGKTVLKSGVNAFSPRFMVHDQSRYSFYCKGASYEAKPGSATVSFYDENSAMLGTTHLFWAEDMKEGATKKGLQPPPGATQAAVTVSRAIFEELRVTKDP